METTKEDAYEFLNRLITPDMPVKNLEIVKFIKKCVKAYFETEEKTTPDWQKYFDKLWEIYPRKIEKQNAKKTFEHKIRGLNDEETKEKCRLIYKSEVRYITQLKQSQTPVEYVKHV